jgi:exonuclease VII small subunit
MAMRQTELAAPAEAVRVAGAKLNQAVATYSAARVEFDQMSYSLFLAEMTCDQREGRLRSELRECAPDCVRETEVKINALRASMIRSISERSWVSYNQHGGLDSNYETNSAEITPITEYLRNAEEEVAEFIYEPATAVEIARKCELLLDECRMKVAKFISPHVVAELLKTAARAKANETRKLNMQTRNKSKRSVTRKQAVRRKATRRAHIGVGGIGFGGSGETELGKARGTK